MEVSFHDESLDSPASQSLLERFNREIAELYPRWSPSTGPTADPDDFGPPYGRFVVVYEDGVPVGCAGLKRFDERVAEIKRLYVAPAARGRGVARMILERLERAAAESGYSIVRLDTGNRQPDAEALFRSAGYREIPDYNGNRFASYWFEKAV